MSPFVLDPFQEAGIAAVDRGESVLVAAPTGAGKTVIAEHALRRAIADGDKAFYTTPIKALSNQKYRDLVAEHGADAVGLLTGDRSINSEAPLVVMTTEVLRNMLYAGSPTLTGLRWVVLDEVHYLRDRVRGPVWEEVIVHAPSDVRLVALSATVSNVDELASWLRHVRGPTALVTEHRRPIELTHHEMVELGPPEGPLLLPLFVDGQPNGEGFRFDRKNRPRRESSHHKRRGRKPRTPRRAAVIAELREFDLLPAIYFLFSRAGCDDASRLVGAADLGLTSPTERDAIAAVAERHLEVLTDEELTVLGWSSFSASLLNGVAAHHAGLVPAFKELVEECFLRGLVKVVFATETLALGINMPARTVTIERLTKFTGETHETLTPLEYTQLTGRAGRRGLDERGTAIVLWSPWVPFRDVAELAGSTEYPLTSAFRPSYNMAANLVAMVDRDEARRLLRLSFAQFQADSMVTDLEKRRVELTASVERLEALARCEHGDVAAALSERRREADANRGDIRGGLSRLRPGSVIIGPAHQPLVVVSIAHRRNGAIRVRAVDETAREVVLELEDFPERPEPVTEVELPEPFDPASVRFRSGAAKKLMRLDLAPRDSSSNPSSVPSVTSCPDFAAHERALAELSLSRKKLRRVERRLADQTDRIDRRFDGLCSLLEHRGCLDGWSLTAKGSLLLGVFHELDLLVAEALSSGIFDGLDAPSLAALASCVTYQSRSDERTPRQHMPSSELRRRVDALDDLAVDIMEAETAIGEALTRRPDEGFVATAYQWADGGALAAVLSDELTGGDFVRQMKQLIDVLRQLGVVAPSPVTAAVARQAAGALDRGVVAAESA